MVVTDQTDAMVITYVFLLTFSFCSLTIAFQNSTKDSSRQLPTLSMLQHQTLKQIAMAKLNETSFYGCSTCNRQKFSCSSKYSQDRTERRCLWKNAEIPYRISKKSLPYLSIIKEAIAHFEKHTCLRFRKIRKTEGINNTLYFIRGDGCWSSIGVIGGLQELSINEECNNVEAAIHEIGHAVGLYHEHSRSDRDQYIVIFEENVIPHMKFVFDKQNDPNYDVPYDYTSIMHYQLDGYSKDPITKKTIMPANPLDSYLIRERKGLSFRDIQLINTMYKCYDNCTKKISCKNTGYVGPTCGCVCPPGTTEKSCEKKHGPYYPTNDCGGMVNQEGTLKSPKHSGPMDKEKKCIWWIKAPKNHRVKITFQYFDLEGRYTGSEAYFKKKCAWDRLELRTTNIYQGVMYCGMEIKPGDSFTSEKRNIVLEYTFMTPSKKGFSTKIIFVKNRD